MLLFPKLTQLDLTGPHEILSRLPGATTYLVARTREPVVSESGLTIVPDASFDDLPGVDLVFAPGCSPAATPCARRSSRGSAPRDDQSSPSAVT